MLKKSFVFVILIVCILTLATIWVIKDQGVSSNRWASFDLANVSFDDQGIPTITADSWERLIQAQGYVVASERMWQMDLLRRYSSGRLSEWFGSKTINVDIKHVKENWAGVADKAASMLPEIERRFCELYALGVNQFIAQHKSSWGIEYSLMRVEPESWQCSDSILVTMYMAEFLTSTADYEARQSVWRDHLSIEWQNFFFPKHHPWSRPMFGSPNRPFAPMPPRWQYLSNEPLGDEDDQASQGFKHTYYIGSNSWAWSNGNQAFLAGDPHLRRSVPQIWYANRLRVSEDEWVVGASLAGVPGIVIGRNPNISWSFTNLGEDVDDYLRETLNEDQSEYVAYSAAGKQYWQPLVKKRYEIKVKNEEPRIVEAWFSHRGPVSKRAYLDQDSYYSRQWTALRPKLLSLPTLRLNQAKNWKEFNAAMDHMKVPAQAVVFSDAEGQIGFRSSGVGIKRQSSGGVPQEALEGEWLGFELDKTRKRLLLRKKSLLKKPNQIVSANAQIWRDTKGTNRWASDDRRSRIMEYLSENKTHTLDSISKLQFDTKSRYHQTMLRWLVKHSKLKGAEFDQLKKRWSEWNGFAVSNKKVFTEALFVDDLISNMLISRVRRHFLQRLNQNEVPKYEHTLRRSWMLKLFTYRYAAASFGLDRSQIADYVLNKVVANIKPLPLYDQQNHWSVQHPFVKSVPLLGRIFRVDEPAQPGYRHLVLAEKSEFGPSLRMVWDMKDLKKGIWAFPTGQSGHVKSRNYRNLQKQWHSHKFWPVFNDNLSWLSAK